ncbi:MAG TPA: heparan-alpha-glucosaminide N-acetyltransferase domain-containing protein [Ohtaekwangia sp.]|uniref:DUF1624 domain-containing protein n=1 Tax=Ohtaekwangia sp. TaxID=2066019 RepID=UPI002F937621
MTTTIANGVLVEKPRVSSIDVLRGVIMIIMALDHTRDFFHADANLYAPTDLAKTSPVLFLTRWITHFCAPTFVLLSGVAARISLQRKSKKELAIFLLTRGLWLILIEVTVLRFAILFNLYYDFIILQVIWVLGGSMVVLSALVYLPELVVGIIGLIIVFGHNIFDAFPLKPEDTGFAVWAVLNQTGFLPIDDKHGVLAFYPLFPWLGIMLVGYSIGMWYTKDFDAAARRKRLLLAGIGAVVLFVILRLINGYGDPDHWSVQKNGVYTLLSFINCTKYPVSLLYTLMTLGPIFLILWWLDNREAKLLKPALVFGRVPLFYYILHFYLLHTLSLISYMIGSGKSLGEVDFHFGNNNFGGIPYGFGYSLGIVYLVWIGLVIFLYPICRWYNRYKSTHQHAWLSYL